MIVAHMTTATTAQGFAYTREQFQTLVDDVLKHAIALGSSLTVPLGLAI